MSDGSVKQVTVGNESIITIKQTLVNMKLVWEKGADHAILTRDDGHPSLTIFSGDTLNLKVGKIIEVIEP